MPRGQPAPEREGHRYPLFRTNDRPLPEDYDGPICIWDIDNTYLVTEWSSLRDLIRIRFEAAVDKRPIPGAVALLKALRRGGPDESVPIRMPIYFVSASPETMRTVLEKRMLLDGVEHDGATFRDLWTGVGVPHLRHLKDVYGYKITALLLYRHEHPKGAREILFGDNREHDPEVYLLYARVCAGEIRGDKLEEVLLARGVRKPDAKYIRALADELPAIDPVERIVIRKVPQGRSPHFLAEGAPFDVRDERILFVDDYAQAAAALRALGRIGPEGLANVTAAVRAEMEAADVAATLESVAPRTRPEQLARAKDELAILEAGRPKRAPEPVLAAPGPAEGETTPGIPPLPPAEVVVTELIAEARALDGQEGEALDPSASGGGS